MRNEKPILKPIYFNPKNPKELELLVWCEGKFASFGGLIKDLMYKEMMSEKGNIIYVKDEFVKVEENISTDNFVLDKDDVDGFDC